MSVLPIRAGVLTLALAACTFASLFASQEPIKKPASDLDAFMAKALARREVNKRVLNDYILDENEMFEILGPGRFRLHRSSRDYTWYVRDGMHVRSPVRFDGVAVNEANRDRYEKYWTARERRRQERKKNNQKETSEVSIGTDGIGVSVGRQGAPSTEPRFVSEAYFMDFKFEPGNYFLAGREKLEGQDVLKIEYYPERLFADDDKKVPNEIKKEIKKETKAEKKEREFDEAIEHKMNKTALVTLWVDPTNHQIVKYTFDNVWMDFLPAGWLVRMDGMHASMTMFQPFAGVWLPRDIKIGAEVTLANGSFEANYDRSFSQYREADVKSKIRIPKAPTGPDPDLRAPEQPDVGSGPYAPANEDLAALTGKWDEPVPGPVQAAAQGPEVIREIRVHGNVELANDQVLKIAAVAVNDPLPADGVAAIERRLKASGRFESVDVRKRYRSIDDPSDVAIVLLVHEKATVVANPITGAPMMKPSRWLTSRLMFLPIVSYADGYGLAYGARVSTKDLFGLGERLSVPATWGGTRRIALEGERTFKRGPFTRLFSSAALYQRENPRYEIKDRRVEYRGRAERNFAQVFITGVEASRASVTFAELDDSLWTVGADVALDTRGNPAFPSNALYLSAGWTALTVERLDKINRYSADGRGYLRLNRQNVLAVRGLYTTTDAPLPIYERTLLGGSSSLRGFDTGAFDGDRTLVTSAELRMPISSVISGAKMGFTFFTDAAKAVDYGGKLKDAKWNRGAGAGLFIIAQVIKINFDVSHGFDGGGTRAHLSSGFSF